LLAAKNYSNEFEFVVMYKILLYFFSGTEYIIFGKQYHELSIAKNIDSKEVHFTKSVLLPYLAK